MIDGSALIGFEVRSAERTFTAIDPASDQILEPRFGDFGADAVDRACALAQQACAAFSQSSPEVRAGFLEEAARRIDALGDTLTERAMAETGLPRARLEGERGRTVGQLRMFAREVLAGHWLDATIDPALPDRQPPRPDLRRMNVAVGPVAVFGASNFPLAFSVAGGDTASAFAAGCPVVVKGHPAHPGTGELVARALRDAVVACGLPEGVFSYIPGTSNELGAALVGDPRIKAVGFTGSRAGGLALVRLAQQRPEPIPVFAEMSSVNPVILLPHALERSAEALGHAFVGSLMMGAGQFCTNPGLIVACEGPALDRFVKAAADALRGADAPVMLTPAISSAYRAGTAALRGKGAVGTAAAGPGGTGNRCQGVLFETRSADFLADPELAAEIFGGASLLVRCRDVGALAEVLSGLEGQLTATVHMDDGDADAASHLLPILVDRTGRILANGWPTGVEVTYAMVHGGPYPATSNASTTSVGTLAMHRFLRPVCFQDIPDAVLPQALKSDNPWRVPRRVDGDWQGA